MTAADIRLETALADAAPLMFDKLMGGLARKTMSGNQAARVRSLEEVVD